MSAPSGFIACHLTDRQEPGRGRVKSYEEIMDILEAYDLTGSYRAAAELAGCDHKTVMFHVDRRDAGLAVARANAVVRR